MKLVHRCVPVFLSVVVVLGVSAAAAAPTGFESSDPADGAPVIGLRLRELHRRWLAAGLTVAIAGAVTTVVVIGTGDGGDALRAEC